VSSNPPATQFDQSANNQHEPPSLLPDWLILLGIWLLAVCFDGFWLLKDQASPAWDQGEHLTRALNYWRVLQQPEWLNGDWWTTLWRQSPGYRAPLVYLATVPIFNVLGRGFDQAVLVNLIFAGLLMGWLYGLGRHLFDRRTGLWAAGLSLLVPSLYGLRLDYLLDMGLLTCVTAAFACLTFWRAASPAKQWGWAISFGVWVGLTMLAKPTGMLFLFVPVLWIAVESLLTRPRWQHILQWTLATVVALMVFGPWFSTNWLTILTNSQSNNANWMPPEVVPGSTWSALSYYGRMVPRMITYTLVVMGGGAALVAGLLVWQRRKTLGGGLSSRVWWQWAWLWSFLLGSYGVLTLLQNKDPRHMAPAVPMLVLVLARALTGLPGRWGSLWRWLLVGLMTALMVGVLWPIGNLPPSRLVRPLYPGPRWPQPAVVDRIIQQEPYLRSTLGVIPNTPPINPMTLDFYGALQDFQVFGREVSFNAEFVPLDARSLDWFITKTSDQGPTIEPKLALQAAVEQSPDLQVVETWPLPDGSTLSLYHRQQPPVVVQPLDQPIPAVRLDAVEVPGQGAPGQTLPVTYQLRGPWEALRQGLLIVTWQPEDLGVSEGWMHDHGIGLGQLDSGAREMAGDQSFQVTERSGMIVPDPLPPGRYRLTASYVDRQSGEAQPLDVPTTILTLGPEAPDLDAPEPDLVGLLHHLSQGLASGELDPVFTTIGRINQYDPTQDYLDQAIAAMDYRLENNPDDGRWLYTRVMAQVLQQDAEGAISTLNHLTTVTPDNIYPWLYLGFVYLYAWQPRQADQALAVAAQIEPDMPELKVLQGVAALQQLRFLKAWQAIQTSGLLD
jgi:4-amino-4-deoxy-L-arabinose transferase-like glycosyltransferase